MAHIFEGFQHAAGDLNFECMILARSINYGMCYTLLGGCASIAIQRNIALRSLWKWVTFPFEGERHRVSCYTSKIFFGCPIGSTEFAAFGASWPFLVENNKSHSQVRQKDVRTSSVGSSHMYHTASNGPRAVIFYGRPWFHQNMRRLFHIDRIIVENNNAHTEVRHRYPAALLSAGRCTIWFSHNGFET